MPNSKLPPLSEVDKENPHLIDHGTTIIKPLKCFHDLELITSTEARCKKCSCGWTGPNIHLLVEASKYL